MSYTKGDSTDREWNQFKGEMHAGKLEGQSRPNPLKLKSQVPEGELQDWEFVLLGSGLALI